MSKVSALVALSLPMCALCCVSNISCMTSAKMGVNVSVELHVQYVCTLVMASLWSGFHALFVIPSNLHMYVLWSSVPCFAAYRGQRLFL